MSIYTENAKKPALICHDIEFLKKEKSPISWIKNIIEVGRTMLEMTVLDLRQKLSNTKEEKSNIFVKMEEQRLLSTIRQARLNNDLKGVELYNERLVALKRDIAPRIVHKVSPIETKEQVSNIVKSHIESKSIFESSTVPFSPDKQEPYSFQSAKQRTEPYSPQSTKQRTEPYGTSGLGPYEMAAIIEEIKKEQAELALLEEWSRTAPELAANEYKKFEDLLSFGEEVNPIVGKITIIALDVKHNHKKVVKYLRNNHTDAYKQKEIVNSAKEIAAKIKISAEEAASYADEAELLIRSGQPRDSRAVMENIENVKKRHEFVEKSNQVYKKMLEKLKIV
ncbi:hypothetical protein [Candidatus Regiella insecticola]|uniref:Uncharacterized protein n=1 Tax=Candidatus Regiella insecticola TaxID=138073 RepID=A0A6L2ZLK3_9ENTR|nr:hypothetical protein [Candidatus Regiella insecticola]GFN45118.1 hypothetical protein RINTU1_01090 [Candidatus Regiella insecticola]